MSRELKFRAFDKKAKVMSPVDFTLERLWSENGVLTYKDFEVMQYTGLKDEDGKEIWEGDIVTSNLSGVELGQVMWKDGAFVADNGDQHWCIHTMVFYERKVKVVGNIYENPELLK